MDRCTTTDHGNRMEATPYMRQLHDDGHWLFRHRSVLPFFFCVPMCLAFQNLRYWHDSHQDQHLWATVCFSISVLGLLIRSCTVGFTPEKTSGRNTRQQVASVLNTTGLYSLVRNPLYLGNFLIWLGIVCYPRSTWLVVEFVLAFWLYYERIVIAEEGFLLSQFGDQYRDWARGAPAFIPQWSHWARTQLPFSLRTVLRREYTAVLGITLAFFLLDTAAHWVVEHRVYVDLSWSIVALCGIAWFLFFRTLKRQTRLLHITGR